MFILFSLSFPCAGHCKVPSFNFCFLVAVIDMASNGLGLEPEQETLRKRKLQDCLSSNDNTAVALSAREEPKRIKLSRNAHWDSSSATKAANMRSDWSRVLPVELWHRIFTYCPPSTLGNVLQVCKLFNSHLDLENIPPPLAQNLLPTASHKSIVGPVPPQAIWRASRRLFCPAMPAPLRSKSELAMWRLAAALRCDECKKPWSAAPRAPSDEWHPGPGPRGVSVVWPFARALCGICLLSLAVKVTSGVACYRPCCYSVLCDGHANQLAGD